MERTANARREFEASKQEKRNEELVQDIVELGDEIFGDEEKLDMGTLIENMSARERDGEDSKLRDLFHRVHLPDGWGFRHIYQIFDMDQNNVVTKAEFQSGMWRLLFCDMVQHRILVLAGIANIQASLHAMDKKIDENCRPREQRKVAEEFGVVNLGLDVAASEKVSTLAAEAVALRDIVICKAEPQAHEAVAESCAELLHSLREPLEELRLLRLQMLDERSRGSSHEQPHRPWCPAPPDLAKQSGRPTSEGDREGCEPPLPPLLTSTSLTASLPTPENTEELLEAAKELWALPQRREDDIRQPAFSL